MANKNRDPDYEGREKYFMDIDRMVNEGLGGGQVSLDNGLIEATTPVNDDQTKISKRSKKER